MRRVILASLLLAGLSLLLPSAPTYDPWSWIVWGREVAHLDLDTTGGPSWKPLPVMFTTVFATTGAIDDAIPPMLWLVVARAGALVAMALVYRLAYRLADGGRRGVLAGVVAIAALAFTPQWLRYAAHGNEAPLAVAAMLWGLERHLDGSHRGALALGLAACLMRPEVFPFLVIYAVWSWRADPGTRRLIAAGGVALPVLWLGPEWLGSGNPLGAGAQARSEPSWSLSRLDHPWLQLLARAHDVLGPFLEAGLVVAVGFGAWRRDRVTVALGAVAMCWVALVAAMTQGGFSGNARYLLPATVIACLLTGVAAGQVAASARRSPVALAAAAMLAALAVPAATGGLADLRRQAHTATRTSALDHGLTLAVARAGGGDEVVRLGAPTAGRAFTPHLAWLTTLSLGEVERSRGEWMVFVAQAGRWRVSVGRSALVTPTRLAPAPGTGPTPRRPLPSRDVRAARRSTAGRPPG